MPSITGLVYRNKQLNELDTLALESGSIIFRTGSVFPFKIFPTTLTISPTRVTITETGLYTKDEYPIPIDFISGARIFRTLFFATMIIEVFRYEKPPTISFLRPEEARLARRYILALVDCRKNNINLAGYSAEELRAKLKKIGKVISN